MRLATAIELFADADNISKVVRKVFNKKTGKGKAYDAISSDIRDTVIREASKISGPLDKDQLAELDDYLSERMGYLKTTFSKLNAPMKDKSDKRVELVGD